MDNTDIVYINLNRSPDRRKLIEKEFARESITTAKRFAGVDAAKLTDSDIKQLIKAGLIESGFPSIKRVKRVGRLGVHLSHYAVWKQFKDNSINDYLLVLEDDIRLALGFRELYEEALRFAPPDWDILFLSSGDAVRGERAGEYFVRAVPGHWPKTNHGLFCYVVRRRAIYRLMGITMPVRIKLLHLDHVIREHYQRGLTAYYLQPKFRIAAHRDEVVSVREHSTIR